MNKAIATLALLAAMISPCLAQDTTAVERCRTYILDNRGGYSLAAQPTFETSQGAALQLSNCEAVDPDPKFSDKYKYIRHLMEMDMMARYENFIQRHKLWNQFITDDAQWSKAQEKRKH